MDRTIALSCYQESEARRAEDSMRSEESTNGALVK